MRVRLKGLNRTSKVLADGRRVTYYYAWKGGPKLEGEPGSPEFVAGYHAAHAVRLEPSEAVVLRTVIDRYLDSAAFTDLAPRTRKDYRALIRIIDAEFGDLPVAALTDRAIRGEFRRWRDGRAQRSKR